MALNDESPYLRGYHGYFWICLDLLGLLTGGKGGIRTHGTASCTPDFESGSFDHSDTFPGEAELYMAPTVRWKFIRQFRIYPITLELSGNPFNQRFKIR